VYLLIAYKVYTNYCNSIDPQQRAMLLTCSADDMLAKLRQ